MPGAGRLVPRNVGDVVVEALDAFRVVVINGPRQSGKSTLLRQIRSRLGGPLHNLDVEALRQAALDDPAGLVLGDERYVHIDEVQRGGDPLVRAVKERADDPDNTTRFLLAGSTNFLSVPNLAESLTGRAVILEVWPFSQGEIEERRDRFADRLVAGGAADISPPPVTRQEYFERICAGGYPEPLGLPARLRARWFTSYVDTITQRDIADFAGARRIGELPRLLRYLAGKTAQELVKTRLADEVGLERHALAGYLPLLETVFLIRELPAWSRNPLGKVTRTPKIHLTDTGLAAHLHGVTPAALAQPIAPLRGQLVETFVHNELLRQLSWSDETLSLFHWRDREGAEVDLVAETSAGLVFGLETKASSTVTSEDFRWLRRLHDKLGDSFAQGVVFYLGPDVLRFGPKQVALPLSALWA